jgi:hypothetical protein
MSIPQTSAWWSTCSTTLFHQCGITNVPNREIAFFNIGGDSSGWFTILIPPKAGSDPAL